MCGIAGWYRRGGRPVVTRTIGAQCDAIVHRGPDDSGTFVDGDFGFGMRRLSILDVADGHQPMASPDGRHVVVFNGEIYNHLDLRPELEAAGWTFRTRSDTETVLAAFAHWRDGTWARLEGMFAVAVWDRATRRLTLARDPLGIKPLYVSEQADGLSFASELKSLRGLPDHRFDVDDAAAREVLSVGHVRHPRTIFRQVRQLAPGRSLTLDARGAAREETFWRPSFRIAQGVSDDEWTARMRSMLLESTARHLQSDVPVGAFLSGGIDSSAVLAAMVRSTGQSVKAFTIGHPGAAIDETAAAAEIARHLGAEHVVEALDPDAAVEALPAVLACYDEPFADPAAIPTWFASRLAAGHVKVVLCGEGGDELFAGYKRHRNARWIERARPAAPFVRAAGILAGAVPDLGWTAANALRQHVRRAAEFASLSDGYDQFAAATRIAGREVLADLLPPTGSGTRAADRPDQGRSMSAAGGASTPLEAFLLADLTLNMPSAMLTRLDRASMAHSLEARVPFLSHRLVDWAMTVPDDLKLRGSTGKYVLRRAVAPWLPPSVMRRPKQGFQIPHADWFRGAFGTHARSIWAQSGLRTSGHVRPGVVERLFDEHRAGTADHARILYAATAFAVWWRDQLPLFAGTVR